LALIFRQNLGKIVKKKAKIDQELQKKGKKSQKVQNRQIKSHTKHSGPS